MLKRNGREQKVVKYYQFVKNKNLWGLIRKLFNCYLPPLVFTKNVDLTWASLCLGL